MKRDKKTSLKRVDIKLGSTEEDRGKRERELTKEGKKKEKLFKLKKGRKRNNGRWEERERGREQGKGRISS